MSLKINEWPKGVVEYLSELVISTAIKVRKMTFMPMIPSPDPEAHVRFKDGSSMHDIGEDGSGISEATDLFLLDNKRLASFWLKVQRIDDVGGFGLYFDTLLVGKPTVLCHLDTRSNRMLWICPSRNRDTEKRTYIYFHKDPTKYLKTLGEELEKLDG